jgi:quinol monooxygenase YgiN
MTVLVTLNLTVKPDQIDPFLKFCGDNLHHTRQREGNLGLTVHQEQDTPTSFLFVEKWVSKEAYDVYNVWRTERGDFDKLAELIAAPPERHFFDHIPA